MKKIKGKNKIKFLKIKKAKISRKWINWLNDPEVRKYSTQKIKHTYLTQKNFLKNNNLEISNIGSIYINRGPGSFAGIRNSLSTIKAIHMIKKIDYYCFSFKDFKNEIDIKYDNIPRLCSKFNLKKNLINPYYLS